MSLADAFNAGVKGEAAPADAAGHALVARVAGNAAISPAAAATLEKHASLLRQLLNMGVRRSRLQAEVYEQVRKDAVVAETVALLIASLSPRFVAGADVTSADAYVLGGLYNLLSLVYPPSVVTVEAELAPVARWFAAVTAVPELASAIEAAGFATGGQTRVGGQVDLRAVPAHVAALADGSIAKNAGHKKAASQRDAEKAAKETPATGAAGATAAVGGAGATPAAAGAAANTAALPGAVPAAAQPADNLTLPTKSVEERIALTTGKLESLSIPFDLHRHAAANTVDEMLAAIGHLAGTKAKNLFIKAKKEKGPGDSRMWLVVAAHDSEVNLTDLASKLGYGKIVLRFADAESLTANLGVVQGHVSPFCLMNDAALAVNVAVDERLLAPASGPVFFHPLTNEASLAIAPGDLAKFIAATGHAVTTLAFPVKKTA